MPYTDTQLKELCAVAEEAARAAGAVALRGFRGPMEVRSKGYKDIVTQFDTEAEGVALAIIRKHCPQHDILAEESGSTTIGHNASDFLWAVDPIDGTHNYAAQLPFWCTSVAVMEATTRKPLAGAVFDALHAELFTAWRGGGTFLNGQQVRVSATTNLEDALLGTDLGYDPDLAGRMAALSPWVQKHVRRYRLLGSAVLSLVYVANGRFDGYYHLSLQPWDIAAAALLIEEAGGTITDWEGQPLTGGPTSAITANPTLQPLLMEMLHKGEF